MAENTKIEWANHTFNPWVGCTKISPGCDHCYAEGWAKRSGQVAWGNSPRKRTSVANWQKPIQWARQARQRHILWEEGMLTLEPPRPRVFCASLADVFDNQVPNEWRIDLFNLIWDTPELDWLLLTKRPENIVKMLPPTMRRGLIEWPNVWLGITGEDQEHFDRRWSILEQIPARIRFVSYEPAIGPLTIAMMTPSRRRPDWIICGGESGPGWRPMSPAWERNIRLDCRTYGVPYFFKQMAGKKPPPPDFEIVREFPA